MLPFHSRPRFEAETYERHCLKRGGIDNISKIAIKDKCRLHKLTFCDTNVLHLQGHGAIRMIKEEHSLLRLDTKECCNISIVW